MLCLHLRAWGRVQTWTCSRGGRQALIRRSCHELSLSRGVCNYSAYFLGSQFGFGCTGALEGRAKRYISEFMKRRTKFRTENLFAVLSTLSSFAVQKADCNCLCVVVCLTGFKRAAKRADHKGCQRNPGPVKLHSLRHLGVGAR
jgi:hypothetical protein